MSNEVAKFLASIPDFIYDFVCRIVPGAVVLHICMEKQCVYKENAISNLTLVFSMWAIGLTLDVFSEMVGKVLLGFVAKAKNFLNLGDSDVDAKTETQLREDRGFQLAKIDAYMFLIDANWRSAISRAVADRGFFRLLSVLCLFIAAVKMSNWDICFFKGSEWITQPAWVDKTPFIILPVFFILFVSCWKQRGIEINQELKRVQKWWETERKS